MNETRGMLDLGTIRQKLAGKSGRAYWRSLEEVAETPEFQAWVDDEFPNRASLMQVDRRSLLKFMGASMMLAGLAGCRSMRLPSAKLVPYVNRPEELVTGEKLYFATGYTLQGITTGIIVESNYGRPTKVEGNPKHPFSNGASNCLMQASILDLYDPDRSQSPVKQGVSGDWAEFLVTAREHIKKLPPNGEGLSILLPTVGSPSMIAQLETLKKRYPAAIISSWEPAHRDGEYQAAKIAFGKPLETIYQLSEARVILAVDSNFVASGPGSLKYAREWAKSRNVDSDPAKMGRLYAVEATPTETGSVADHRLPLGVAAIGEFVQALASRIGAGAGHGQANGDTAVWLEAVAQDLEANRGHAVVIPGNHLSPEEIALCHQINEKLGANGKLISYHSAVTWMAGEQTHSLARFADNPSETSLLLILGGNPAFNAPSGLKIADLIKGAALSAHLSPFLDETSRLCQWHLPESHALEQWGDGQALDGTTTLIQPLIEPLYDTKSTFEVLNALFGEGGDSGENLKASWAKRGLNDKAWRLALNDGIVPNTFNTPVAPTFAAGLVAVGKALSGTGDLEIVFRPDPTIFDGRFANNGWLQELPKPLTTLTWDNSVQISPKLAERLGAVSGDLVKVATNIGEVVGGAWVLPGQAENTVTIHYGYGRDLPDSLIAAGTGFNAYKIWDGSAAMKGSVAKAGGKIELASTQMHHYMEGRDIVREMDLDALLHPHEDEEHGEHHRDISMFPDSDTEFPYDGPKWGMTIDLNVCTGCHSCVTACQAENNIAVVGKDQVLRGREMHWIRIDRYYGSKELGEVSGKVRPTVDSLDNPTTHLMPVTCMHCEMAPCEPVCPVAATVHSKEGLNQMVYNRCVGTRYCSNNCPYKVRRFNFLNYNDRKFSDFKLDGHNSSRDLRVRLMVNNPEVTVRGRGVMEKCTYCVQRINAARIHAKNAVSKGQREKPDPMDGEIVTACQQACPTGAITFGNLADENSRVSRLKKMPRNYSLLEELNTRNRTTYLTKLRNPNKEIETA